MSQDTAVLAPPPRTVSGGAVVEQIFGSTLHQMCWLGLMATTIFFWFFTVLQGDRTTIVLSGSDFSGRWALVFPAFGLFMAGVAVWDGLKKVRLLREGLTARGKLVSKEATNFQVNNQRVYNLTFAFKDAGGQDCRAVVATHETESAEDDAEETVLYDPKAPGSAAVLDALTGNLRPDAMGGIEAGSAAGVFMALAVPVFTLAFNAAAAWYVLSR